MPQGRDKPRSVESIKQPSITVVVPVYNGVDYLSEALTAILSQTRPAEEVIVVDDGSTDDTPSVLAQFGSEIRIVRQRRRGHPGAYNRGFAMARGDYVARCDADDVWEPDKLERQSDALAAHPQVDIVAGAAWTFGRVERLFSAPPGEGILESHSLVRKLYRANWFCASSMLIRRRLFEQIGPFADGLVCEDYDFWLRAASAGAVFFYDPAIIVRYRRHGGNVSNDLLSMARAVRAVHLRHAGWVGDNSLTTAVVAHDFANVGRLLVDQDARTARREYVGALRHRLALRPLTWAAILSLPDRCQSAPIKVLSTTRDLLRRLQVPGSPGR